MSKTSKKNSLEAMIAEGPDNAYEALQLYKSKINRLRIRKEYLQSIEICVSGCINLLKYQYESAANELSLLFIEILNEYNIDITPEYRNLLNSIDSAYPINSTSRSHFLRECLKYSVKIGSRIYGDPLLHTRLAENLWSSNEKPTSIKHFALGESPETLWQHLQDSYSQPENVLERNRYITTAIVYFLAYENIRDANTLMSLFHQTYAYEDILIEFCDRLLLTSLRDAAPLFQTLVKLYTPHLSYDPVVLSLLKGPISKNLFNIDSPPSMLSMIQSLLSA